MDKLITFLLARLKEPSSWAALGANVVTGGILSPERHPKYWVMIGVLCAMAGAGMSERSAPVTAAAQPSQPATHYVPAPK